MCRAAYRHVYRDDPEPDERPRVPPLGALRPVPEREDEAHDEHAEVEVL